MVFHATDQYTRYSRDSSVAAELYPLLFDIIKWHRRGMRFGIHMDAVDGLLASGVGGVQLTWLDATMDGCAPIRSSPSPCPTAHLKPIRRKAVVDACARHLLTPHGLRSLALGEPGYVRCYTGGPRERDSAYHHRTVWAWLIGPFVDAHYRRYGDTSNALRPDQTSTTPDAARSLSAFAIISTRLTRSCLGAHPSSRFAFDASPTRRSTSAGR
jgi:glycogen debranching enzyme